MLLSVIKTSTMKNGNYHRGIDICWNCLLYQLEAYVSGSNCRENEIILMIFMQGGSNMTGTDCGLFTRK